MAGSHPYHHGDLKKALIQAGIEILDEEGLHELSLRKAARRAGVSHSAPYAHFTDKQALVAAISTEGFRQLLAQLSAIYAQYQSDPARLLVESAWCYLQFGLGNPAQFKIMLSGVLEKEQDYPDLVAGSIACYRLLVTIAADCQAAGVLKPGSPEMSAITLWSLVHGLASLTLERQVPLESDQPDELKCLLVSLLNQVSTLPLET